MAGGKAEIAKVDTGAGGGKNPMSTRRKKRPWNFSVVEKSPSKRGKYQYIGT